MRLETLGSVQQSKATATGENLPRPQPFPIVNCFWLNDAAVLSAWHASFFQKSDSTRANLFSIWVMSSERGVGVGRALVDAAIKWAKSKGVSEITLHVTARNDEAKRLYEAAGFVDSGRREPLRPGSSLHEEVMVMRLC